MPTQECRVMSHGDGQYVATLRITDFAAIGEPLKPFDEKHALVQEGIYICAHVRCGQESDDSGVPTELRWAIADRMWLIIKREIRSLTHDALKHADWKMIS